MGRIGAASAPRSFNEPPMKPKLISAGVVVAIMVLVIAYLLGKRVGRTKSTVVEIRRI